MISSGVVLRDEYDIIRGAWTNCFQAENAFCTEAKAAIQALKVAADLKLVKVSIEGDAHNVIMALKGLLQFEDWKAKKLLESGKVLFNHNMFWFLFFVHRSCNLAAHHIAK